MDMCTLLQNVYKKGITQTKYINLKYGADRLNTILKNFIRYKLCLLIAIK
jgi:hypothetical protein